MLRRGSALESVSRVSMLSLLISGWSASSMGWGCSRRGATVRAASPPEPPALGIAQDGADEMFGEPVGLHAGPVTLSVPVERRESLADREALIYAPLGEGGAQ
jgi:hypothetical protein